ncbi:MAG TPA: amino acid permease [Planctomycetota bacterium]|nr:amino acid permease [Planctomycetota bacterium]
MPQLKRLLGLRSAILLVVGSVIGSGIFLKPLQISQNLPSEGWILAAWAILGLVCLCGAFAYAELGAMFPEAGGQYAFIREAWGRFPAFLYGWTLMLVINSGTLAALAVIFGKNIGVLFPSVQDHATWVAVAMIAFLAMVNHVGTRAGAWLQDISTLAKIAALLAIAAGAFFFTGRPEVAAEVAGHVPPSDLLTGIVVTSVALFWTYEGWHQISFSAGEMKDPGKNLPRGLILGMLLLIAIYTIVNAAYLAVIPLEEMRGLSADVEVPKLTIERFLGAGSGFVVVALISLSVLGCSNPNLLSTPRAFYAMALDGQLPRSLLHIHPKYHTPTVAIWTQAAWSMAIVILIADFHDITEFVVFASLLFYALAVAGVYKLRKQRPDLARPYRCFLYPVTPAIFIAVVLFVDIRLLMQPEERTNALYGLAIIAVGAAVALLRSQRSRPSRG